MRNRVAVDDMILNGVKPWIVSKEDEQTQLTCLNSMRLFHNCYQPLMINGTRESVVMEQIQNALKIVIDRKAKKPQQEEETEMMEQNTVTSVSATNRARSKKGEKKRPAKNQASKRSNTKTSSISKEKEKDETFFLRDPMTQNIQRNVIVFTGRALQEITRDLTMQKAFMTLAYISDMMVGSEISPIQKQKLLKIAKSYIGEGEYAAAIVTTPEDQFMVNEADLCANLKVKGKSADFQAVVDVTLKDFSAMSYLLFKHGNQIQMRISKASQAFYYRSLVTFLILCTYMIRSGFSGSLPFTNFYYYVFMLLMAPAEILIYSTFYKDVGYEYLYRIYGHYKLNFSFSLVEHECVVLDSISAFFDWLLVYMPHELVAFEHPISLIDGKEMSGQAYNCYQVILMQIIFYYYFRNTNVQVSYAVSFLMVMTLIGCGMIFDDENLVGVIQLFTTPCLLMTLLLQVLILSMRNAFIEVCSKLIFRRYADLHDWYADIEDRLSFEEYEDPDQSFSIQQFTPMFSKINAATIQNTLKLINMNMMKVPKTEQLDQILDKINTELDIDRRAYQNSSMKVNLANPFGVNHMRQGTQLALATGSINRWTLSLNDMNQETEYQENKNLREIVYVRRQMLVFVMTTMIFSILGLVLYLTINFANLGLYYYIGLSLFTLVIYHLLPQLTTYISNFLLFYTIVVIFCYTIYTSEDSSLQPTGLIFVLALVAGLNHSFIYPTVAMIMGSVLMHIFFSIMDEFEGSSSNFNNTYRAVLWIFVGVVWSVYVYMQELEKKTSFVSGHKKVRYFQKLKQILNILVPSLVRDKIRSGKKNFSDDEGEVTIIFIDIHQFDHIVDSYKGQELLNLLDTVYNAFDQLCDQYGLQKVETVGKTYMACGGLKSAERKIESRLLNRHHSVRVTDFGLEIISYIKTVYLKNGKSLEVKIGIHTGPVISGVVGDTKPQFSLIGDTVNKTSRVCSLTQPNKCSVSKETRHYLELYTNNLFYSQFYVMMKGIGREPIFIVGVFKGNKNIKGGNNVRHISNPNEKEDDGKNQEEQAVKDHKAIEAEKLQKKNKIEGYQGGVINELQSNGSSSDRSDKEESNRGLNDQQEQNYIQEQENEEFENESNLSGQIDDATMNVFGFNDDLNLDDRIIVQNATDNQIYQVVERPRLLMQFEQKDLEQDFLYQISKAESKKTTIFLAMMIILNKVVIFSDILQDDANFVYTFQFFSMFPIFVFEMILIYKLNNPTLQYVHVWTMLLLIYGIIILMVLLSYQLKYLGQWTRAGFNELQIQLTLSMIFFMRNVMLRHFLITYTIYMVSWILIVIILSKEFDYQIIQFIIGQIMYALLLAVGIHHREMIQRKSLNYERILNVEINKTNELISKLVPYHMVNVIKNEKRHVDEFDDCTLLFTDMVKFTAFSKNVKDPREVVNLLSKLFSRFDQVCEQNRVYKVHTIGDCYVIMGYNGRIDKSKRTMNHIIDEAHRVIKCGLEMIDIIAEIRNQSDNENLKALDMRIGVHTGRVVAGIIGSKVVRYDIFGSGVLIANKMESNGIPGKVCISEDTRSLISKSEVQKEFIFIPHNQLELTKIGKSINCFVVEKRTISQYSNSELTSEEEDYDSESDEKDLNHSYRQLPGTVREDESQEKKRKKRRRAKEENNSSILGKKSKKEEQKLNLEDLSQITEVDQFNLEFSSELKFTNFLLGNGCMSLIVWAFYFFAVFLITYGNDFFKTTFVKTEDLFILNDPEVLKYQSLLYAEDQIDRANTPEFQSLRSEHMKEYSGTIFYDCLLEEQNPFGLWSKQKILKIYEIEKLVQQTLREESKIKMCLSQSKDDPSCSDDWIVSPLQMFPKNGAEIIDLNQTEINKVLSDTYKNKDQWKKYEELFEIGLNMEGPNEDYTHVRYLRSIYKVGFPLKIGQMRYKSKYDRTEEQGQLLAEQFVAAAKIIDEKVDAFHSINTHFSARLYSKAYYIYLYKQKVEYEYSLFYVSLCWAVFYWVCKFNSIIVAFMCMMVVGAGIPLAFLMHQGMFGIDYWLRWHYFSAFIIINITSNNAFFTWENWKRSKNMVGIGFSYKKRLAYAVQRSFKVNAASSSAIACSFSLSYFSTIQPIQSLGIFSAILIMVNFISLTLMFPAIIVVHEEYSSQFRIRYREFFKRIMNGFLDKVKRRSRDQKKDENLNNSDFDQTFEIDEEKQSSWIQKAFEETGNQFVRQFRWAIIGISLAWFIVAFTNAVNLDRQFKEDELFDSNHWTRVTREALKTHFLPKTKDTYYSDYVFGIEDFERFTFSHWGYDLKGDLKYDENFDRMESIDSQDFLLRQCALLRQKYYIRENVDCWIEDFAKWFIDSKIKKKLPNKKESEAKDNSTEQVVPGKQDEIKKKEEEVKGLPLFSADQLPQGEDFASNLTYWCKNEELGIKAIENNLVQFMEGKLKLVKIRTKISSNDTFDLWQNTEKINLDQQKFVQDQQISRPISMNSQFVTGFQFTINVTAKEYMRTGLVIMLATLLSALVFIFLLCPNIIILFLSMLSIAIVIISVIAWMNMVGWEYGLVELLSAFVVNGFPLDQVIRLTLVYHNAPCQTRNDKMKYSFETLGVSTFHCFILSFVASFPLIFCELIFLRKSSMVVMCTLLASFGIAYLFYSASLHIIGPQEGQFDIPIGDLLKVFSNCLKSMLKSKLIKSLGRCLGCNFEELLSIYAKDEKEQTLEEEKKSLVNIKVVDPSMSVKLPIRVRGKPSSEMEVDQSKDKDDFSHISNNFSNMAIGSGTTPAQEQKKEKKIKAQNKKASKKSIQQDKSV